MVSFPLEEIKIPTLEMGQILKLPQYVLERKMVRRILLIASNLGIGLLLALLTATGVSWAGETIFPGGTLDDLRQLSSTLTFDHLRITGTLSLPVGGSATLKVNKLTITESGGVSYTYSPCTYLPAPDFTVQATGGVVVNGDIILSGRYGTRTLSGSDCNQCGGEPGGDIRITADEITLTGQIRNRGGSGSTSVSDGCSFGCEGGDAGGIFLTARNITLIGADLQTRGGTGGTGYCYGDENHGSEGEPGQVDLMASGLFLMNQSSIFTDGTLTLQASSTDIYGPIQYGQLNENIGGQTDELGPEVVEIVSPLSGSAVSINDPLEIRIRLQDNLTGVKEVQVTGLGHDELHSGIEIEDGILSIMLPKPTNPASLQVIAYDNKGNSTSAYATGLRLEGSLTIAAGDTYNLSGDLDLGSNSSINILGTLVIKRGSNPKITSGSFTIANTGRIEIEDPGDSLQTKAPSVTVALTGTAEISGTVDLSGHNGFPESGKQNGEEGGDFTLSASSIVISGSLASNGGDGRYREDSLYRGYGGAGGDAGMLTLVAYQDVQISGAVSAVGGRSINALMTACNTGGDGGHIFVSYGTSANTSGASFTINGGEGSSSYYCDKIDGVMGWVLSFHRSNLDSSKVVPITESEPNDFRSDAQIIFPFVRISGSVTPDDEGELLFSEDDYEDLYQFELSNPLAINLALDPSSDTVDVDVFVADPATLIIYGSSLSGVLGATERIENLELLPGKYVVCVSQWGTTPPEGTDYTLTVTPAVGIDSDGDGMSDWWEVAYLGSLERDGILDWDGDGLSDKVEYDKGTHPKLSDSDGDNMPDGWEVENRLDPLVNDANEDPDRDGFTNLEEYNNGTDPNPTRSMPWLPLLLDD